METGEPEMTKVFNKTGRASLRVPETFHSRAARHKGLVEYIRMAALQRGAVAQAASPEWPLRPNSTQSSEPRGRQVCQHKAAIVLPNVIP